jgi:SAM-dependent methyltransferase
VVDQDKWNNRYLEDGLLWSAEPNSFLVDEAEDLPPGRALDLGAGEGRNAIWLAGRGWRVTAVDYAEVGLDKGRRIASERGVEIDWVCADIVHWLPKPASSDLVLLIYLHLPDDEMRAVISRAQDAVAPGGVFLLIGHDRSNLDRGHGGPQDPAVLYTADDIASMLTDLVIETAETRGREVATDGGFARAIDCIVRAHRPR